MREYFTNVLMVALAIAFLVHFTLIAKQGQVLIQEPNVAILGSEIVLMIAITGYGIFNLKKMLKRKEKEVNNG